eukprot:s2991_g12.t1
MAGGLTTDGCWSGQPFHGTVQKCAAAACLICRLLSFPGVPMPASLIFDNPSVRALSVNIHEELKTAHEAGRPLV